MARKDGCYAPVFERTNWLACIFLAIIYTVIILLLLIFFWVPGVICRIKQYVYRIRYCAVGNSNPDIPL